MAFEATGSYWEDFTVGHVQESVTRVITREDVDAFTKISDDDNPLHTVEAYAKASLFGGIVAHGMLVLSATTGLTARTGRFVGTTLAFVSLSVRFISPVFPGDTIRCRMKVKDKKETDKPDRGLVTFDVRVRNQNDRIVAQTEWVLMMKRKPGHEAGT